MYSVLSTLTWTAIDRLSVRPDQQNETQFRPSSSRKAPGLPSDGRVAS